MVKTYHANKHATIIGIVLFWYILEKVYKYYYPQDSCSVLLNLIKVLFKTDDTMTPQVYTVIPVDIDSATVLPGRFFLV